LPGAVVFFVDEVLLGEVSSFGNAVTHWVALFSLGIGRLKKIEKLSFSE
jgi:hypothetical protein